MASTSHIEWTEATWNPVTGCTKVSSGCDHCYAERMHHRLQAMGAATYHENFDVVRCHWPMLSTPVVKTWRKPRHIFVCSMSDLFHPAVTDEFIRAVFQIMADTPQHTYQVLTKRPWRMRKMKLLWPANVWAGVTAENQARADERIPCLLHIPAAVKFVSIEPLLGPVDITRLSYQGDTQYVIDPLRRRYGTVDPYTSFDYGMANMGRLRWVIVGGESGPGARPLDPAWVRAIRDQCIEADVQFFFKQWGGVRKASAGRQLDGRTWDERPGSGRPSS